MPQLKLGIQLASLRMPFRKALETAARLGADAVEVDARNEVRPSEMTGTGLRHLRKLLEDYNLRVAAVRFLTRRGYDVHDELDRRVEATRRAMKMAYDLGASVVINHVGRVPEEADGRSWELLTGTLEELGRYGQHVGAFLAAETGSESPESLRRLIDALPDGTFGVNLDPGNLAIHGYSSGEAVDLLGQFVLHVHAKDGVRDLAQGRGIEVPLGRGSVDFPALIGRLEEFGYRGYFTIEREHADDPVFEVGQAVKFLRQM
ncbi:MAG: sugar phosphate isomerase/epimerase [Planctomycetales bacterium]|nr:sugar phosphate isomerase/epimerase [Planctomycetales bacterium]